MRQQHNMNKETKERLLREAKEEITTMLLYMGWNVVEVNKYIKNLTFEDIEGYTGKRDAVVENFHPVVEELSREIFEFRVETLGTLHGLGKCVVS